MFITSKYTNRYTKEEEDWVFLDNISKVIVTGRQWYAQLNGFPKYKKKNLKREAKSWLRTAYLYSVRSRRQDNAGA